VLVKPFSCCSAKHQIHFIWSVAVEQPWTESGQLQDLACHAALCLWDMSTHYGGTQAELDCSVINDYSTALMILNQPYCSQPDEQKDSKHAFELVVDILSTYSRPRHWTCFDFLVSSALITVFKI
jgi:hypothetical protein